MNEDPTRDLPDDGEKTPTTRVMLETVLARMNDLSRKYDDLSYKFDGLSAKVEDLGVKMDEGFDSIGHQLMVISGDITRLRADAIKQAK